METDVRNVLENLSRTVLPPPAGVAGIVRSVHRDPALREWVTLESVLLMPVPFQREGRWMLAGLLACPVSLSGGEPGYAAPWGAVEWEMPAAKVARTLDLSTDTETSALQAFGAMLEAPADPAVADDPETRQRRQGRLCKELDALFVTSGEQESWLQELAALYSGLLPGMAYPYYWKIAPGTALWLRPNVPASPVSPVPFEPPPEFLEREVLKKEMTSSAPPPAATPPVPKERLAPENLLDSTPSDLTDRLEGWLAEAQALAQKLPSPAIVQVLRELQAYQSTPVFRLTFVGEFSRGKSTLLNRLFGRELLPVGVVPVTAHPTVIKAGERERLEIVSQDGRIEERPLGAWDGLTARSEAVPEQNREALIREAMIRVTVSDDWLESLEAEFIDTPGVNDIDARRVALVIDMLSRSDGSVVVLSALQPLSMTEMTFLEQQIVGQRVPRVFAAVSRLDQLPLEKRTEMLEYIKTRIAQVSPSIPVLALAPTREGETDAEVLTQIRAQIGSMAAGNDRRAWRSHQVAWRISDHLRDLGQFAAERARAADLDISERAKQIAAAKSVVKAGDLNWEAVGLELADRRRQHEQVFRQRLESGRQEMLENLQYDLSRSPDPKTWWERDLPFRLRRELAAVARRSEQSLTQLIAADYEWLRTTVKQRIGSDIIPGGHAVGPIEAGEVPLKTRDLTNVIRYRLMSRVGLGVGAAAGMLMLGPIGIAASAGLGAASEALLNRRVEEQKQMLVPELERCLDRVIDEGCRGFGLRLTEMYASLANDIRTMQVSWQQARLDALEQPADNREQQAAQEIAHSTSRLSEEIGKYLKVPV